MKILQILSLILIVALTPIIAVPQTDDKTVIDKYIANQAKRERGEEPDDIRKTIEGDLNHDGVSDVAVLYTIEGQGGSNNYIQYLAVFVRKNNTLVFAARAAVGGKNHRDMEITSIQNNAMLFNTTSYGPRDPSCCPTIKGSTRYLLAGNKLIEKRQK